MFLFNTEKAERTEMHREKYLIGMRDGKRDLKVFHRGWRMKNRGAALCAEHLCSSCYLPCQERILSVFLCVLVKPLC